MPREALLQVKDLHVTFNAGKANEVRAVNGISFEIFKGETFGLVGESGCGKSTTGRTILHLVKPTSGEILFQGEDIYRVKNRRQLKDFQRYIQMIFQDPYASLDARMKVRDIIAEGMDIHKLYTSKQEREQIVRELLVKVGLSHAHADLYPSEFSGGQRQRIGIARALAVKPKLIVADEPISALDVSIQAQVVNLMKDLQIQEDLTFLFIAHDLSMVRYISDRIGVMYNGRLVELAEANILYENSVHPYTKSLLSAIPIPEPLLERSRERIAYNADVFASFEGDNPTMKEIEPGHFVYCTEI
ncbi:ABC transporter ATP-binding protein [Lysinibacillus sp. 54212]|uniref:ABC transporter ATP-binding protein n=1 Tax=Lysinibacillus sp. 54212 TaxID=3119829 RepID=UPI002FC9BA6C